MNSRITSLLVSVLGRRNAWRLARSLYLKARADSPNNATLNGEENLQRQLLASFAKKQEKLVVFDVGANVGDWSWFLLENAKGLESRMELHSFEPMPSTFARLQERIQSHKLAKSVRLSPVALSSERGIADLYISGETALTNSLHPNAMHKDQKRTQIQKSTALDYCTQNGIATIHFLKCDTEGHDMEVLKGARKLFDDQRIMACQFEYNHRWIYSRHYLKDVFDLFEGTPYTVGKVTPNGIELYPSWHPELERFFEGNYMLLHSKALDWFTTFSGKYDSHNTYSIS